MDILEEYAELLAGIVVLAASFFLLFDTVIDPALEDTYSAYQAKIEKSTTFNNSYEDIKVGDYVLDEEVYSHLGDSQGTLHDSGIARMSFRAEQFIMLPVVDADISSNARVANGFRTYAIAKSPYRVLQSNTTNIKRFGIMIDDANLTAKVTYPVSREALLNRTILSAQMTATGIDLANWATSINSHYNLASNGRPYFGAQRSGDAPINYGGFNLTIDSSIHPISGKKSNSVIFIDGRVSAR